jgi:hypothetical protein
MAINNSIQKALHDFLLTRNLEVRSIYSKTGETPLNDEGDIDFSLIDLMIFSYVGPSGKNYGTVTVLIDDGNLQLFFGDKFGRGMEPEDKQDWFGSNTEPGFLEQLKSVAVRHSFNQFQIQNPSRLKYTKQGIAAIKKGLLESFSGNRKYSFTGDPEKTRLMIKHSQPIESGTARFRFIENLFIETAEGERFKLPFRKLSGGRAMLEHVRQGGRPYDERGVHITEMVEQINVLSHFRRASQNRIFEAQAQALVDHANIYYENLKKNLKRLGSGRGYQQYFESWSAQQLDQNEIMVEDIKNLFVEQKIDPRIQNALPLLKKIHPIQEAEEFANWADDLVNPMEKETRGEQAELANLLKEPLAVGPNGINAEEQLYELLRDQELSDIIQNYATQAGPEANAWDSPEVMARLKDLGVETDIQSQDSDQEEKIDEAVPLAALAARAVMSAAPTIAAHKVRQVLGLDEVPDHNFDDDTLERIKFLAQRI